MYDGYGIIEIIKSVVDLEPDTGDRNHDCYCCPDCVCRCADVMSEKSKLLYDLMLRKGYPEAFTRLICTEMNTDFTAERMISYISRGKHRLEDVADEMLAIRDLRDQIKNKHISEHAQAAVNDLYRNINED